MNIPTQWIISSPSPPLLLLCILALCLELAARIRTLGKVNANEDLGRLPELDAIDDVLEQTDRAAYKRKRRGPRQHERYGPHVRRRAQQRGVHPLHEVECHIEELVRSADKEEGGL
jgi:hypothetical protein